MIECQKTLPGPWGNRMGTAMFLQKLISAVIYPLNFSMLILLLGLLLLARGKGKLLGKWLVGIAIAMMLVTSYGPFARWFAGTLERQYAPFSPHDVNSAPSDIFVLSGGAVVDRKVPPLSRLSHSTVDRLSEVLRLYQLLPGATIHVSSAQGGRMQSIGETMKTFLVERGVPDERIVILRTGWNTAGEARAAKDVFGEKPFILVTSAVHMPRTMMLFEMQGLEPVPAPVRFYSLERQMLSLDFFVPTVRAANITQTAYHEYVGILWALLTGG